jgi:hypothetical protein
VKFVSAEPLLERMDFRPHLDWIDWIITGRERAARGQRAVMDLDWVRDIDAQCKARGKRHFFKQAYIDERGVPSETPRLAKTIKANQQARHLRADGPFPTALAASAVAPKDLVLQFGGAPVVHEHRLGNTHQVENVCSTEISAVVDEGTPTGADRSAEILKFLRRIFPFRVREGSQLAKQIGCDAECPGSFAASVSACRPG